MFIIVKVVCKMTDKEPIVCVCGDAHKDDNDPEQCPKCERWFVGQCASDNLLYYDDDCCYTVRMCMDCDDASSSSSSCSQ